MQRTEIERLLPTVFRRTLRPESPLAAFLAAMEELHAPAEAVLAELPRYFDPQRAPEELVPFLARWVHLERLFEPDEEAAGTRPREAMPPGRLRELTAAAARLARWRGTPAGLVAFLETATGVAGFTVDERVSGPDGRPRPFHIRVHVPAAARPWRRLVERIVALERPAYVTWEIDLAEARGGTSPPEPPPEEPS